MMARPVPESALGHPWPSQEPEVQAQLAELCKDRRNIQPEDIKVIDNIIAELIQIHENKNTLKPY